MAEVRQYPLQLSLNRHPNFDNFVVGENALLLQHLHQLLEQQASDFLFIWGAQQTGKSHLLMALCNSLPNNSAYFSLSAANEELNASLLDELEQFSLVCLDDIDTICGNDDWELALFHCYNRIRSAGGRLLVSAHAHPRNLPVLLPDLKSRLMWGACYQLQPLKDAGKMKLLMQLAEAKGIRLEPDAAKYIITRCSRDTAGLLQLMEQLDRYSLSMKQQITIPLIRNWLSAQS